MNKTLICLAALALVGAPLRPAAFAASVPHTFTAGTVASAAEVNANFEALVAAVNALEAKLGPHSMASLAGTYDYFEVKIDVDNLSASSKSIAGGASTGTIVLNANGTGQANVTSSYRQVTFNAVLAQEGDNTMQAAFFNVPESDNEPLTWSYADGVVSVPGAGDFIVVGQLLMQSMLNEEGQNGISILARR